MIILIRRNFMAIIKVENLTKEYKSSIKDKGFIGYVKHLLNPKYKTTVAVNNISFDVEEGELVGYIGENGAGKSTTIKMLTGLLTPTSGNITVNGIIPNEKRIENNKQIGAIFGQKTQLWWDLPVIESFRLIKKLYQISDEEYEKNLKRFIEVLDIEKLLNSQVKNLSLGQKMKCEIAATFLHNPKIVYLDEPTIRIRYFGKRENKKIYKRIKQRKKHYCNSNYT
jgi:ABC-2 type transport system ATP-binding protein